MLEAAVRLSPTPFSLAAMALLGGGCAQQSAAPANTMTNRAAPAEAVVPTPREVAERLVRQRLGTVVNPSFTATPETFNNGGAVIVCGRFDVAGQPAQRYIAIGEEDVFIEGQMAPGLMDQAVRETCVNAATPIATNASNAMTEATATNRAAPHP